jgi:L-ascorbate metabolism protein UlaG (beta-lactamase superfamily)
MTPIQTVCSSCVAISYQLSGAGPELAVKHSTSMTARPEINRGAKMSGMKEVYLKQNVLAEPLINKWYAWACLIPPATAAMFTANQNVKIMQSFIANPQIHISALANPSMMGGPFINYDAKRVNEIKALLDSTMKEQAPTLELAKAIRTLDEILRNEADGHSLEPIYHKVPDILKGYVELVYDLNNHPSIRFIEGLLYKSPHYDSSLQGITLSLIDNDYRPFVFSTPRLEEGGSLYMDVPFNDESLDALFKAKSAPQSFDYLKKILNVEDKDEDLFASFFTEESPPKSPRYTGEGVRIRYFGHACVLIESKNCAVICDPLVNYKYDNGISHYTYVDLPEQIDYVLITHNHQDHCIFETLLQLRHKIRNVLVAKNNGGGLADPSLKLVLQNIGFDNVREIDEMESVKVNGGTITGLPFFGEHADVNVRTKIAYLVSLEGKSILFAADSNNIEPKLYEHVHESVGDIDVVFLGMECAGAPLTWIYGPLLTSPVARKMDQSRRCNGSNCEKGMGIINQLHPKQVYVYAMGLEPWLNFLTSIQPADDAPPIVESNKLIEDCRSRGITAERLYCQKELFLN